MGRSSRRSKHGEHLTPVEQRTVQSYDATAESYDIEHRVKAFWLPEMRHFYELLPEGKILEIGSCTGRDARILTALGYGYVGTDASQGCLAVARRKLPGNIFYPLSVYELHSLGEQEFDGFWTVATLLHVPKSRIDEALSSIRAAVKPGGIGFISLRDGTGEGLETKRGEEVYFMSYWRKEEFNKALTRNGFAVIDYTWSLFDRQIKWHCFFVQRQEAP